MARESINAGISLPKDMIEFLNTASKLLGISKSEIVQSVIEQGRQSIRRTMMNKLFTADIINDIPIQLIIPKTPWMQLVVPTLASGILTGANHDRIDALCHVVLAFYDKWPTSGHFRSWYLNTSEGARLSTFAVEIGAIEIGSITRRFSAMKNIADVLAPKFATPMRRDDVMAIAGVGEYTADSYAIFYLDDYTIDPANPLLKRYVESKR